MGYYPGPLEDDDQLGQPPASVPPGDPRAGLYAYLAQQAAIRQQGQSVPSYEQVQQRASENAQASARNAFGAQLQNSASMMGTLNGKRADYSGPSELAKSLDKASGDELSGDYQALAQRNKDVLTEGSVYKDLTNPDLARARLYSGLMAKVDAEKGKNDRNDANNKTKKQISDDAINAGKYTGKTGAGVPYQEIHQKDGIPHILDRRTGDIKPVPPNFMTKAEREAAARAENPDYDANGDKIDPNADEPLNTQQTKDYNKLLHDSNPALASSRSDFGKNQATVNAAKRLEPLYQQGLDQKGGLNPTQMTELAAAAASLISGGNATAQAQVEHLTPQSAGRTEAEILQWLTNDPKGANQMKFAEQLMHTARREGHLANENLNTSITSMYNNSPLYDVAPKRMEHSYYSKVGDDAAYDEQGRYIQEPYDEKANGRLLSVGQSPIQLEGEKAPRSTPAAQSFGPSANPDTYNSNLEQEYARTHGISPARAKAILEMRRRKNGV